MGRGFDFERIAPILLIGYDKFYYRKHALRLKALPVMEK